MAEFRTTAKKVDAAIGRFYESNGFKDYFDEQGTGKFYEYIDANGFADDEETFMTELNNDAEECLLLDFDDNLLVNDDNRNQSILNLIRKCINNPDITFNDDDEKTIGTFKVWKQHFVIADLESKLNKFHKILKKNSTCEKICKNAKPTGSLMQLLYISQHNICQPYIHLLADLFARDCMAYYLQINPLKQKK
eukprot:349851_1